MTDLAAVTEERTCRVCFRPFKIDPARFAGRFKLPALCLPCFRDRRDRMVTLEGTVIRVGSAFPVATIEAANGELFFWRYSGGRPRVGDRVQFARDPEEVEKGGRLPLARGAQILHRESA